MINPLTMMMLIIAIPFIGMLFVLISKNTDNNKNAFSVAIFSIITNISIIWQIFSFIKKKKVETDLIEKIDWLTFPNISLTFSIDNVDLLLILAIHIILLTSIIFNYAHANKQKYILTFSLLFLSMITGLFISNDIFSFFIFYEGIMLPVFMLIGIHGEMKKKSSINSFFIYNFIGCLLFLGTIIYIYQISGNITLDKLRHLNFQTSHNRYIWFATIIALMFRIPIWPFHYFISSVNTKLRNSLVFTIVTLLPLSGLYGIYCFWPNFIPIEISQYFIWINIIGALTMLFLALMGYSNPNIQYRIFAFASIYYVLYLLGLFSNNKMIYDNFGYAVFSFLLILGTLEAISNYIYQKEILNDTTSQGFLCRAKKLSFVYSFLIFSAIGLPISAMFTNNFLIFSYMLSHNIHSSIILVFAWMIICGALINEIMRLKTDNKDCKIGKNEDLPTKYFMFILLIIFMILMSFIKPLWFVIDV